MIRKLRPETLERWEKKGRVLCACVTGMIPIYLVGVYGFPPSHEERCNNDAMFADCLQWATQRRDPVLILGDFNESYAASASLTLAQQWGFWRVTDDSPTTRGKSSRIAGGSAIDHVLANKAAYDIITSSQVRYDLALSDHFPIVTSLRVPTLSCLVWHFPRSYHLPDHPPASTLDWKPVRTMTQWTQQAQRWIAESYGIPQIEKNKWTATMYAPRSPPQDKFFNTIRAVRRALEHCERFGEDPRVLKNMRKRLYVLGIEFQDLEQVATEIGGLLTKHLDKSAELALKSWKGRVALWHAQSKELFQYLRNTKPARSCVIQVDGVVLTDPVLVSEQLLGTWGALEFWTHEAYEHAMYILEDHLAAFLPRLEMRCVITAEVLHDKVKRMKKTAPGVDGWTQRELKALPRKAWENLIMAVTQPQGDLAFTLSYLFKRIPVEKGDFDVPSASDLRPIDIFSMIWRVVSSAQSMMLRE